MHQICRRSFLATSSLLFARSQSTRLVAVGEGYAKNSINSTIFSHPLATQGSLQYIAWYAPDGSLMLGKRELASGAWSTRRTNYRGNIADAHNGISLAVDGGGILHMAWDHHDNPLNYVRSVSPGMLDLTGKQPMNGDTEGKVTYPEFFPLPQGGLLFLYRDGASGKGNTILKRYNEDSREWTTVNNPLISGGGSRNAYTNQIAVDSRGRWHISWCWRETADVATNHDICYAFTDDEGWSWRKSSGATYELPISAENVEVVARVPQGSDLINQCTMTADSQDQPLIATYWRAAGEKAPQYRVIWNQAGKWRVVRVGDRNMDFSLSGGGARRIPMSRPLIVVDKADRAYLVHRDEERERRVSVAISEPPYQEWRIRDLTSEPVDSWEPTFDASVWRNRGELHLFHQRMGQGDGEKLEEMPPQTVSVLEWWPEI